MRGKTTRVVLVLVALLGLVFIVAPAGATPPLTVSIDSQLGISTGSGSFNASGPAVDGGVMCEGGQVDTVFFKASGGGGGVNFQVIHRFTCDDRSGDFLVKLQVRLDQKGDNFDWVIVGGTGAYEDLHGAGIGIGVFDCGDDCVRDLYDGKVHID